MNEPQLVAILDHLGTSFNVVIPSEAFDVWWEHVQNTDAEVALAAAHKLVEVEDQRGLPLVATFKRYVAEVLRDQRRLENQANPLGRHRDCGTCKGKGWYEVIPIEHYDEKTGEVRRDEQWRPCSACSPRETARWEQHKLERARQIGKKPAELLERDPQEVFDEARAALERAQADAHAEATAGE